MTASSPLVLWLGVAAVLGAVVAAVATTIAWPRLQPALMRLDPARCARVLTALCLAPVGAGAAIVLACLLPSLYSAMWPGFDHCTRHADEHLHLCLAHPPAVALGLLATLAVAGALTVVLARSASGLLRLYRAQRVLARLHDAASPTELADAREVDTEAAFSFTGGVLRSTIYVSRAFERD